eukprot:maker-scaffold1066_size65162-snap-gene-0.7 protein:Tk09369 transcript:maker-scaffold1066_size65162-snap-gene-0.7-mRNA-1 annotation:"surface antigen repeat family protein"
MSQARKVQIYDSLPRSKVSSRSPPPSSGVSCRDYYGPPSSSHYIRPSGTSRYLGRYDSQSRSTWNTGSPTSSLSRESSLVPRSSSLQPRDHLGALGSRASSRIERSMSPNALGYVPSTGLTSSAGFRSRYDLDGSISVEIDLCESSSKVEKEEENRLLEILAQYRNMWNMVGTRNHRKTPYGAGSLGVSSSYIRSSVRTSGFESALSRSTPVSPRSSRVGSPNRATPTSSILPSERTTLSPTPPSRNCQYDGASPREQPSSPLSSPTPPASVSSGLISGYRRLTGKSPQEATDYEVGNSEHLSRNAWSNGSANSFFVSRSSANLWQENEDGQKRLVIGSPDRQAEEDEVKKSPPATMKLNLQGHPPNKGMIPLGQYATSEYLSGQQDSPRPEDHHRFALSPAQPTPEDQEVSVLTKVTEDEDLVPYQGTQKKLLKSMSEEHEPGEKELPPKILSPTMSADSGVHSEMATPPDSRKTSQNGNRSQGDESAERRMSNTEACDKISASKAKIEELQGSLPRSYSRSKGKRPQRPEAKNLPNASRDELEAMLKSMMDGDGRQCKSPLERIHDLSPPHSNANSCLSLANSLAESQKVIYLNRQKAKQEAKERFFKDQYTPSPIIVRETNELLQRQDVILEGLKLETEELKDRIRLLEDELDCSESQVLSDLELEVKTLQKKLAGAQTDRDGLQDQNDELKTELEHLESEVLEAKDHFRERDFSEWKRLQKDLGAMAKSCRNFQLKLRRAQLKRQELRLINRELNSNLSERELDQSHLMDPMQEDGEWNKIGALGTKKRERIRTIVLRQRSQGQDSLDTGLGTGWLSGHRGSWADGRSGAGSGGSSRVTPPSACGGRVPEPEQRFENCARGLGVGRGETPDLESTPAEATTLSSNSDTTIDPSVGESPSWTTIPPRSKQGSSSVNPDPTFTQ